MHVLQLPARIEWKTLRVTEISLVVQSERADQAAHHEIMLERMPLVFTRIDRGDEIIFVKCEVDLGTSLLSAARNADVDFADQGYGCC